MLGRTESERSEKESSSCSPSDITGSLLLMLVTNLPSSSSPSSSILLFLETFLQLFLPQEYVTSTRTATKSHDHTVRLWHTNYYHGTTYKQLCSLSGELGQRLSALINNTSPLQSHSFNFVSLHHNHNLFFFSNFRYRVIHLSFDILAISLREVHNTFVTAKPIEHLP